MVVFLIDCTCGQHAPLRAAQLVRPRRRNGLFDSSVPSSDLIRTGWGKPEHNFDEVVFTPISNDATRVAALLSGDVDWIDPVPQSRLRH